MKSLLVAINAKYIHSNLAVYSLKAYAGTLGETVTIKEYTINQYPQDILADIYKEKADFVAFSCYIWNIDMVQELLELMGQVMAGTPIWLGGPEVSYDAQSWLSKYPNVTGVMCGEGEAAFKDLLAYYEEHRISLGEIQGLVYRQQAEIIINAPRPVMDLSQVPFVYKDMDRFQHKIIYYETSRGCPFSCSYCLSSIDKCLRFRSLDLVFQELQTFIDLGVPQVKFVDRTFNCDHGHAMAIWQFIKEKDRGITNFHFEIAGDLLNDEEITLLNTLRPGLVQLEIGVQSTNEATIKEIHRHMDLDRLTQVIERIHQGHNIHQHLDLIAGLPYEDLETFKRSFNQVYAMAPQQLQLGFLKVLKGSYMYEHYKAYEICFQNRAPYEVLSTRWLSYEDLLLLKGVEEMVEVYYNSRQFENTLSYLIHFYERPFDFYEALAAEYEALGVNQGAHNRMARYEMLRNFVAQYHTEALAICESLMVYDLYLRENLKSRPEWAGDNSQHKAVYKGFFRDEPAMRAKLPGYESYDYKQIQRLTHIEYFPGDMAAAAATGQLQGQPQFILFDYLHRDPLDYRCQVINLGGMAQWQE